MRKIVLILLVCVCISCVGCGTENMRSVLSSKGVLGEHQMVQLNNGISVEGSVQMTRGFFNISVTGDIRSERSLLFYWVLRPNEIIATTLPYSKFRFVIDETKSIPTIEFCFTNRFLSEPYIEDFDGDLQNPNDTIMGDNLEVAIVRISSSTMAKEIYI